MRTFRLKVDVPDAKKGAIFKQTSGSYGYHGGYACITPELLTHGAIRSEYADCDVVEKNPDFFEEVFNVQPEYATKKELAKLKK